MKVYCLMLFVVVLYDYRCTEEMEQHFEQSVLSKLPDRYKSHLKQSVISEEDDMGNLILLAVFETA